MNILEQMVEQGINGSTEVGEQILTLAKAEDNDERFNGGHLADELAEIRHEKMEVWFNNLGDPK